MKHLIKIFLIVYLIEIRLSEVECDSIGGVVAGRRTVDFRRQKGGAKMNVKGQLQKKYTTRMKPRRTRTRPVSLSMVDHCRYIAHSCLRGHDTGTICAHTVNWKYMQFKNWCVMEYVNCMESYEMFTMSYLGECVKIQEKNWYEHYPYWDDYQLDMYYVYEDAI